MPSQTQPLYAFNLPFEVWQHISSFLSVDEVWVLQGLNRMLRGIALDTRFRCIKVNLSPQHPASYARRFRFLGEDHIAKRVKEIHFLPHVPQDPFDVKGPRHKSEMRTSRSQFKGIFEDVVSPESNFIVTTIARFKKASLLRIEASYDTRLRPPVLQLIHGSLRILANTIRNLTLMVSFDMMSTIILPDLVLTRLEALEIVPLILERPNNQSEILTLYSNTLKATLLPFVNRHRLTLKSFNFVPQKTQMLWISSKSKCMAHFNMSLLFEGINHIPHLVYLSVSVPATTSTNDATQRFFALHSQSLRHLQISMAHMSVPNYLTFLERFEVPLPQLEVLTLDCGFRSRSLIADPALPKFLGQYASNLISLKLLKKQLGKCEIFSLFEIPHGSPVVYNKLRRLEVCLYCLTPEIIDMLACSLPALEELDIAVRIFKGETASNNGRNQVLFVYDATLQAFISFHYYLVLRGNVCS
uniref:F-box domain-containing protein n=1 Tax=Psilocybe cubensis TaxID=181762 RepID=A0A8H7XK54_PSICU